MPNKETQALSVQSGGAALEELRAVALALPDVEEDPTEKMLAYVASAPPEAWEALWQSLPNLQDNPGRRFRVETIRARPSDFEGALGIYLICEGTWLDSGERSLLTCSSIMGIGQLLVLHRDQRLPADLEIVRKEKPTRRGFHPIHFRYLDPAQVAKRVG